MDIETIRTHLASQESWENRPDGWWLVDPTLDVTGMARLMGEAQGRLVTITARPAPGGECRLAYHWDLAGDLLTLVTVTRAGRVPSIAAACPAADWVEREIHDYFAVDFTGRADLDSLMLPPDEAPGLFRREGANGGGL